MYRNIPSLITNEESDRFANLIRRQPVRQDDDQIVGARGVWYGLPFCNILLGMLCERMSQEAGRKLLPTYTYCRIYTEGNELMPHRDRQSCEWSVTINLAQTEPWPLYIDGKEIIQKVGDGALYQGHDVYHWRKPFTGNEYIQIFLHYVDANGPYKDYIYDSGDHGVFNEPELRFTFQSANPNSMDWYKFPEGFTAKECDTIIQTFKGQELTEASVGEGVITTERRSRVFWIPKIKRNAWIYERVLCLIGKCNDDFFKFQLTELTEDIQFTKYDETFQGKYDWHVDNGGQDMRSCRKLSFVLQLSCPSEYEGGELQFCSGTDEHIEVANNNKGSVIIFPSYVRHRATEVTKGTRYSLVTWVNGPPFR